MADTTATSYEAKCEILADVWIEYRDEEAFQELMEFADLGFPLAYAVQGGIIESNERVEELVEGTFTLLLQLLKVDDTGFDSITQLFDKSEEANKSK